MLTSSCSPNGAAAFAWRGAALVAGTGLAVRDAAGAAWTFGADDPDVQHRRTGGVAGGRIVRNGLDLRLTVGLPPDGSAAVFRLDVTNLRADAVDLVLEATATLTAGTWDDVAALGARTAHVRDGVAVAHTFVPDDGAMPRASAGQTPSEGLTTAGGAPAGLVRTATLAPGETNGWTVCLGVGATAKQALGAVFPHLSGARSRAALAAAKGKGQKKSVGC